MDVHEGVLRGRENIKCPGVGVVNHPSCILETEFQSVQKHQVLLSPVHLSRLKVLYILWKVIFCHHYHCVWCGRQLCGVGLLLSPLQGLWELKSGGWACMASVVPCWYCTLCEDALLLFGVIKSQKVNS